MARNADQRKWREGLKNRGLKIHAVTIPNDQRSIDRLTKYAEKLRKESEKKSPALRAGKEKT